MVIHAVTQTHNLRANALTLCKMLINKEISDSNN